MFTLLVLVRNVQSNFMRPARSTLHQSSRTFKKQIAKIKVNQSRNNRKTNQKLISKNQQPIPVNSEDIFSTPLRVILKYGLYSCSITGAVFGAGAVIQYINQKNNKTIDHVKYWNQFDIKNKDNQKEIEFRKKLNEIWNHLPRSSKFILGVIGCNMAVFVAWKLLPLSYMTRWFTLSAMRSQNAYITMITSNFSHKHLLHICINMYVFLSFAKAWNPRTILSKETESVSPERFLSFYIMAGVYGCYLSLIVKTLSRQLIPSLGASASIMGLVGYICDKQPDNKLSTVFIPQWQFSAGAARDFILAFEVCGLILGALTKWRYYIFDHAGHLGGMLFGIWYAKSGENTLNKFCKKVMIECHKNQNK